MVSFATTAFDPTSESEHDHERDPNEAPPTHEIAPDALILICETCESYWEFDPETSPLNLGRFREDHEQHLGHRPDETVRAGEYFEPEQLIDIECVVDCEPCGEQWQFAVEEQATEFVAFHEIHTGHEPGQPRKHYADSNHEGNDERDGE